MRTICVLFIALLIPFFQVHAQKVSMERLNKLINDYAKDGYKLESSYYPDFSSPHPNTPSRFIPCYTGKEVFVVVVMGFKPANYLFKVMLKGKEVPKTHELQNLSTNGENIFYDYRALKFGPMYVASSSNCINVICYDKSAMDKPVYTLVFTKPVK